MKFKGNFKEEMCNIQSCAVLLGFQGKLGLYKYSLRLGKFEYFPYLALLDRQARQLEDVEDWIYNDWLFLIT